MFVKRIGQRSNKVKNTVEGGAVKKFAEAIGDSNPIYIDEETGRKSRYQTNIAPPTFPIVFDYGVIEGIHLPEKGLIHGEQVFHYERPLQVGEELLCYSEVQDYYEKNGGNGKLGFLVLTNFGEDLNGNLIFSAKMVVVITEALRRVMTA